MGTKQSDVTLRQVMVATAMHLVQIRNTWREWARAQLAKGR